MEETKTLHFSVDSAFVTDLARTWFWDENRPYRKSEELLSCCLMSGRISDDERRQICLDIIEGRKKLVGIDICQVVEDGENIRSISEKLEETRRKLGIVETQARMMSDVLTFVDPYSTVKSIKSAHEHASFALDYDSAVKYFCTDGYHLEEGDYYPEYEAPTRCGMWLFNVPDTVYDILEGTEYGGVECRPGSDTFWQRVYDKTKDTPGFEERSMRYLASARIHEEKVERERDMFLHPEKYMQTEPETERIYERTEPDDIVEWQGLIDREGNFYSCGFGGHEAKASHIVDANIGYYQSVIKDNPEIGEHIKKSSLYDTSLELLYSLGWCSTRYLCTRGNYIDIPSDPLLAPTKAQKDRIWEAVVKFDISLDEEEMEKIT